MIPLFHQIEQELQRRQAQANSVRGLTTPFRVEFRYPQGTRHYQYFTSIEDANTAEDSICGYGPTGRPFIRQPLSKQIQVRGLRNGWKKLEVNDAAP